MRPDGRLDSLGVLRAEIKRNSHRIRRLHAKLFYRPLLESVARMDKEALVLGPEAAVRQLAALGYTAPEHALGHLTALTSGASRKGRIQALLLPTLLESLADTPDPDAGLLAYRRLSDALVDQTWFLRLLRDEAAVAERLMTVLGSSAYLPDLLIKAPDVIRLFADSPSGPRLVEPKPEDVARGILTASGRHSDPNRAVAAARSLRRHELARIASADILGMLDVPAVCKALSSVWAAVLNASLSAVIKASVTELGTEAPASFSVIGMGRLGGGELGYGSDADVLFVCEPREASTRPLRSSGPTALPTRCASFSGHRVQIHRSRSTPDCARKVATDRWYEPWSLTTRTTRSGLRRGRFKHSFVRTRWPVILNWDCGSCT